MNFRTRLTTLVKLVVYGSFSAMVAEGCGSDSPAPNPATPDGGPSMTGTGGGGNGGSGGSVHVDAGKKVVCESGAPQCLGDSVMRICSPDGDWVNVPCGSGETCSAGKCVTSQACTPGDKKCATDGAAKVCDNDGSAWVVSLCGDGKICKAGDCVLDLKGAPCTPGADQCVGTKTRLRCTPAGQGFTSFDCPANAPCTNGECQGPVCNIDATDCSSDPKGRAVVRTCKDGTGFTETPCAAGESCSFVSTGGVATAKCISQGPCQFQGQRVCGNPTDASIDPTKLYSECRVSSQGTLTWAPVNCTSPATCDPASPGCTTTCLAGETRCSGDSGIQTCGSDGTWGTSKLCNTGSASNLACIQAAASVLADGAVSPPGAKCVDRACALLANGFPGTGTGFDGGFGGAGGGPGGFFAGGFGAGGVFPPPGGFGGGFGGGVATGPASGLCDGVQIRQCGSDGTLKPSADCKTGVCRAVSSGFISGYHPGVCSNDCKPGESRCVTEGLPLYYTCNSDGTWSTSYQSCSAACSTATDADGLRTALCGDNCLPGSTRCDGDNVQTCGSGKTWLPSVACTVGRCSTAGGSAACQADCVPGGVVCAGSPKAASDGLSTGLSASATCSSKGTLPTSPTACAGTQTCRTSNNGQDVGCVECIGTSVPGGNSAGLVDSRCTSTNAGLQTCNAQNAWGTAADCGTSMSCFVGRPATCGACPNVFSPGACTQSFLLNQFGSSCQNFGLGASQPCGSTPDCCSVACNVSTTGGFAFCAPSDFSPCVTSGPKPFDLGSTVPQSFDDTTLLADDSFTPSCGAFFGSIADNVYSFTAPQASTYSFDTFGSASTTFVSLRDSLACNELGCSNQRVIVSLGAGQRVLVIVDAFGDFTLNIADVGTPGCGNGVVEQKEQCDGHDFNGLDCFQATLGSLPFGTLSCTVGCTIDTSGCLSGGQDGGGGFGGFGGGFGGSAGFGASPGGFPGAGGAIVGDASIVGPPGPSP